MAHFPNTVLNLILVTLAVKKTVENVFRKAGITIRMRDDIATVASTVAASAHAKPWDITVNNPRFFQRVISDGLLGLGESYMDGDWDCERIDELAYKALIAGLDKRELHSWKDSLHFIRAKLTNLQTKHRSKKVAEQHYDIGNELYELMLGKYMAYSCGYWRPSETNPKGAKNLDEAQLAKLDLICRKLKFKPGDRVLEIGCGWGGFLAYAAKKYKISAVGITLSKEQAAFAREKCKGLPVQILLQDYRDVVGKFDHVVSIGMFEHVGPKNYRQFMEVTRKILKDDGLQMLHTVGQHTSVIVNDAWTHKYIFPNSQAPSLAQIAHATEGIFHIEDHHVFGMDYYYTLHAWHDNFNAAWHELQKVKKADGSPKYDERFRRMWHYYLMIAAGLAKSQKGTLFQIVLSPSGAAGGYRAIRY